MHGVNRVLNSPVVLIVYLVSIIISTVKATKLEVYKDPLAIKILK